MPGPPPPPPPAFNVSAPAGQDPRGMLLNSIRAGKSLRKTVTVDKSAPAVSGRVKDENSPSAPPPSRATTGNGNVGGAPNLGGLFTGGMPKLKATGLRQNIVENKEGSSNSSAPQPSVKRGPPPIPPPATQKPQVTDVPSPEPAASKGFGKPTLAPKPPTSVAGTGPQKPSPPPKKLNFLSGPNVSRAQSMRLPRSPPLLTPVPSSLHQSQDCLNETQQTRPVINRARRPPVARPPSPPIPKPPGRENLREVPREPPTRELPREPPTRELPREPPTRELPREPQVAQNPPPATTRVAPPPPSRLPVAAPSMPPPPPPPPFRSTSMHQRLAPPPPPTPPTRVASAASSTIRNGPTTTAPCLDLEIRFAEKFHPIINFPNPAPFRGFPKVYNSKNAAKQQAPAPPVQPNSAPGTMLRLNASSGGKEWQHNAASSAC